MDSNIIELVKLGHERAAELKASCGAADVRSVAQLISDLASQLEVQFARSNALAAENAVLKEAIDHTIGWVESTNGDLCDVALLKDVETPATDAFLAEVRAHDLNALIQHHSAELDAHIKNGGEQFDEKSVRIRDIIVSARLFREQLRHGGAA